MSQVHGRYYIDRATNELVIVIDQSTFNAMIQQNPNVRVILNGTIEIRIKLSSVLPQQIQLPQLPPTQLFPPPYIQPQQRGKGKQI